MRISTSQMHQSALNGMLEQQSRLNRTQLQIASGKRIQKPSDDPAGSTAMLALKQTLASTEQYQKNAESARIRLSQEEDLLAKVNNVLDRVRELSIQANNAALSPQDRDMLAVEVEQRLDEVRGYANARDANGEYLFAGYKGSAQPFVVTGSGAVQYAGDSGRRFVQVGADRQLAIGDSGVDVFMTIRNGNGRFTTSADAANTGSGIVTAGQVTDGSQYQGQRYSIVFTAADSYDVLDDKGATVTSGSYSASTGNDIAFAGVSLRITGSPATGDRFTIDPSQNQDVFVTLQETIQAMRTGDQGPRGNAERANALGRAIVDIDQAMENVRQVRADVGARLNIIDSQTDLNDAYGLQLKTSVSDLEDLDYADAVTRLNRHMVGLQAAQQSYVRIQSLSLFNFL